MNSSQCQVKVENDSNVTTISVAGALDGSGHRQFNKVLSSQLTNSDNHLLVNFTDTSCISGVNLRSILNTYKVLAEEKRMSICCAPGQVKDILEFSGLSLSATIYDDVQTARDSILKDGSDEEH